MAELLSNVFYDPSSPWYYVIGVVFLVLIFGALTAYIMLTKKKASGGKTESDTVKSEDEKQKTEEGDAVVANDRAVETEKNDADVDAATSDPEQNKTE